MPNRVMLAGYVADEPFIRATEGGKFARVRLVTVENVYVSKIHRVRRHIEWHTLSFWGAYAEVVDSEIKVGSAVMVEGAIRSRDWSDKDGVARKLTEIHVNKLDIVESIKGCELPDFIANKLTPTQNTSNATRPDLTPPADDPDGLPF